MLLQKSLKIGFGTRHLKDCALLDQLFSIYFCIKSMVYFYWHVYLLMFVMIDLNVKAGHVSSTLGQCYVCSLFIEVLTTIPKDEYTAASSDIIDAKISCCLVANFYVNICLLHNFCHYYQLNIFFYNINGCFGRLFIEFQSLVSILTP